MRLFKKSKKKTGWLSFAIAGDNVFVASVAKTSGAQPTVLAVQAAAGVSRDTIDKLAGDAQAAGCYCTTLLTGGDYQILNVEAPNVPSDEVKTAVRWRLKDILDFPAAEATIDVLDIALDANSRAQQSVFVVAAKNSIIAPRQKLFLDAKVELTAIDIPEMAQRNVEHVDGRFGGRKVENVLEAPAHRRFHFFARHVRGFDVEDLVVAAA